MAEKRPILVADNGCLAYFKAECFPNDRGETLWLEGRWPLAEFDDLVAFVDGHRKATDPKDPRTALEIANEGTMVVEL